MQEEVMDIGSVYRQITVHKNGSMEDSKQLQLRPDWCLEDLLCAAELRLGLAATPKRLFNSDGMEISDIMMIDENATVFVSAGPDFVTPGEKELDERDDSDFPSMVGGYKVLNFLGRGGFGEVRVGEHHFTKGRVALKFMKKSEMVDIGAAQRTATEVQCLSALKHQNIIGLVQHIDLPRYVVIAFELAEGGDMYKYLCGLRTQKLSEDEGRSSFHQILCGVSYAHNQHICHRDLKLDNVLLQKQNSLECVKIADFGLSDFYRPGMTVRTTCGSLSYLAPEVFRGTSNAGPPLDIWSLGVMFFAMLCGRLPFEGADLRGAHQMKESTVRRRILRCEYKIEDGLSPEAKDMIRSMLRPDPSERISMCELLDHCWLRASHMGMRPKIIKPKLPLEVYLQSETKSAKSKARSPSRQEKDAKGLKTEIRRIAEDKVCADFSNNSPMHNNKGSFEDADMENAEKLYDRKPRGSHGFLALCPSRKPLGTEVSSSSIVSGSNTWGPRRGRPLLDSSFQCSSSRESEALNGKQAENQKMSPRKNNLKNPSSSSRSLLPPLSPEKFRSRSPSSSSEDLDQRSSSMYSTANLAQEDELQCPETLTEASGSYFTGDHHLMTPRQSVQYGKTALRKSVSPRHLLPPVLGSLLKTMDIPKGKRGLSLCKVLSDIPPLSPSGGQKRIPSIQAPPSLDAPGLPRICRKSWQGADREVLRAAERGGNRLSTVINRAEALPRKRYQAACRIQAFYRRYIKF